MLQEPIGADRRRERYTKSQSLPHLLPSHPDAPGADWGGQEEGEVHQVSVPSPPSPLSSRCSRSRLGRTGGGRGTPSLSPFPTFSPLIQMLQEPIGADRRRERYTKSQSLPH